MKKFLDLSSGDNVYIIEINQLSGEVSSKYVKNISYSSKTQYQSSINEITLHFKNSVDTVRVTSNSSSHSIIHSRLSDRTETLYFADKNYIEIVLKEKIEKLRKFINNLENAYNEIWEEFNKEETKSTKSLEKSSKLDPKKLTKGDLIYIVAFESVAVYDGIETIYFADGDSYELSKIKDYRKADSLETNDFFDISLNRIKKSPVSSKIKEILEKCGYRFLNNKFIRLS